MLRRRERTVGNKLSVNGQHVLELYRNYKEGIIHVNRRYQRRLVWTLDDKRDFIDTILRRYPIPFI